MLVGFLNNPNSGRNRRKGDKVRRLIGNKDWVIYRDASDEDAFSHALEYFSRHRVDVIAVNAGDGTIQSVLTWLFNNAPLHNPPVLALLPGGSTNMTAYDILGRRKRLERVLHNLICTIESGQRWQTQQRPVLEVLAPDSETPRYGMFFGVGAIVQGMKHCHRHIHTLGIRNEHGAGMSLVRSLIGILRKDENYAGALPLDIGINGDVPRERITGMLALVSTLDRLLLGTRPYWGREDAPLHFTVIRKDPQSWLTALPGVLRGKPNDSATLEHGYRSHNVNEVQLLMDGHYSLDGELYPIRRSDGPLRLRCGGTTSFLTL